MSCESGARAIAKVAARSGIVSTVSKFAFNVGKAEALNLLANTAGGIANLMDKSLGEKAIMGERIGMPGKYITEIVKGRQGKVTQYRLGEKPPQAGRPTIWERQEKKTTVWRGKKLSHKFLDEYKKWHGIDWKSGKTHGGGEMEIEGYTISKLLRKCKDITPFWAAKFMEHLEQLESIIKKVK